MGSASVRAAWLLMCGAGLVSAAPVLRLSNTVVYPGNTLQACNVGDGAFSVGVSAPAGVPWLSASVGGLFAPGTLHGCVPIQFNFNTTGMAAGIYSASVTVFAPGAVDSPQIVVAVLDLGGINGPPIESYLTPGATCDFQFASLGLGCPSSPATVSTLDGGMWLSVSVAPESTLNCFSMIYTMHLAPSASMPPGTYSGSVSGYGLTYTQTVNMNVVPQPLAVPAPSQISLTLAQGGPAMTYPFVPAISLNPAGTVAATSATASGAGIGASVSGGLAIVSVDPASLAPGSYSGAVTIGCNAADCPLVVPISLTIVGPGPPVITPGVFDNVTFATGPVAPGEVLVLQGEQLSASPPQYATGAPLPTALGGASVLVNGVAAPLYYSSSNQIAFQLPGNGAAQATVQVQRGSQVSNTVPLNVQTHAPQIAAITGADYSPRDAYHPAHAGDTIILWAIGLGATEPVVQDGAAAPSNPPAMTTVLPYVQFGPSVTANPIFAGLSPGAVGLYQVNVTIPPQTPAGNLFVKLVFADVVSNAVPIAIQ